jgi:hypothetical protein
MDIMKGIIEKSEKYFCSAKVIFFSKFTEQDKA